MLNKKELGRAIKEAIDLKIASGAISSKADVARAFKVKPPSVEGWISRGTISKSKIDKLFEYFSDVVGPEHWGLKSRPLWNNQNQQPATAEITESNVILAKIGDRRIPLIDYVQAGKWTEVVNSNQLSNATDWILTDLDLSDNAFALEIKGESMLPRFKEGDRIIVDPTVYPLPGDFVVAKNGEHEATFKKYRPRGISEQGKQVFELVPLNEDFATLRSDICQITIIGTMVEHRSYRKK